MEYVRSTFTAKVPGVIELKTRCVGTAAVSGSIRTHMLHKVICFEALAIYACHGLSL